MRAQESNLMSESVREKLKNLASSPKCICEHEEVLHDEEGCAVVDISVNPAKYCDCKQFRRKT
jgi:hypothetical protein